MLPLDLWHGFKNEGMYLQSKRGGVGVGGGQGEQLGTMSPRETPLIPERWRPQVTEPAPLETRYAQQDEDDGEGCAQWARPGNQVQDEGTSHAPKQVMDLVGSGRCASE